MASSKTKLDSLTGQCNCHSMVGQIVEAVSGDLELDSQLSGFVDQATEISQLPEGRRMILLIAVSLVNQYRKEDDWLLHTSPEFTVNQSTVTPYLRGVAMDPNND